MKQPLVYLVVALISTICILSVGLTGLFLAAMQKNLQGMVLSGVLLILGIAWGALLNFSLR